MIVGQEFNPFGFFHGYWVPECVMPYDGVTLGAKLCLSVLYRFIGKNEEAWPSQEALSERMGCSERTIHNYIQELEQDGFIKSKRLGLGMTNRYSALWHPVFEQSLRTANFADQVAVPDQKAVSDPERKAASDPTYSSEESHLEESQTIFAEPQPSEEKQNPEEDLNLEDDIETYVKNIYRRLGKGKPKLVDRFKNDLAYELFKEEQKRGTAAVRRALVDFLAREDDWAVRNKWPLYAALKAVREVPAEAPASATRSNGLRRSSGGTPQAADAPQRAQIVPAVFALQELDAVAQWNAGVVNAPRADGLSAKERAMLAKILREEPNLGEKFGELVTRVEKIWTNMHADWREGSGWFSFDGIVLGGKWAGVLRGKYDYLMRSKGENGRGGQMSVVERARAALKKGAVK